MTFNFDKIQKNNKYMIDYTVEIHHIFTCENK